jgi:WD40 repeat protein
VAAAVSAPGATPAFVSLCGHASPVVSMQGVAHAGCVVSGSQDGSVRAWDARSGAALWLVDGLTRNVGAICVDEAGRRLLSDGAAEDVVVFDFAPDFSVALRDEQPP